MSIQTIERPQVGDPALDQGEGKVAHIVKDPGKVTEAYVMGTSIEAECGHVWVPTRDAKNLPLCKACKEVVDARHGEGFADGVK